MQSGEKKKAENNEKFRALFSLDDPNLFSELRFFGLQKDQKGLASKSVISAEIADHYSLVTFDATSMDETDSTSGSQKNHRFIPTDLWKEMCCKDAETENKNRRRAEWIKEDEEEWSAARRSSLSLGINQRLHTFKHPASGKDRLKLKKLVKQKYQKYNSLCEHYWTLSDSGKKSLTMLAVSIALTSPGQDEEQADNNTLCDTVMQLNAGFTKLIKKLERHSQYRFFIGYSKLVLIDEKLQPFIHIIFYLENVVPNTWYLLDIAKTWHKHTKTIPLLDYYSFAGILSPPPSSSTDDVRIKEIEKKIDAYSIKYRSLLQPLLSPNRSQLTEDSSEEKLKERLHHLLVRINAIPASNPKGKRKKVRTMEIRAQVKQLEDKIKRLEKFRQLKKGVVKTGAHAEYLLRVAKKYVPIPNIRTNSDATFTYRPQYTQKGYVRMKSKANTVTAYQNAEFWTVSEIAEDPMICDMPATELTPKHEPEKTMPEEDIGNNYQDDILPRNLDEHLPPQSK